MPRFFLKTFVLLFISLQITFFSACKNNNDEDDLTNIDTTTNQKQIINEDAINEIISSFSSPVEMAALIKNLNHPFSKKYLVDPEITQNYDTNTKKAFALGVLSADLGYLNVYERTNLIVQYLSAIKKIADDLRISQFFDFQALKRLSTSNDNIDSLQFLSVQSFRDMDQYLRESGRSSLSLLAVTGVWVESLYLLTQVARENPDDGLKERIGEQKILFNLLYPIFTIYKDDPYFAELEGQLQELHAIYEKVEITYQAGDNTTEIIDGHVTVIQNEKSIVNISEEQLQQIILTTEKIRNNLINL